MQLKNSTLSFIRHLLTSVGTAIATASPDPTTKAIAAAVAAAAAAWGVQDEYLAENPGSKPPTLPPGVVAPVVAVLIGIAASIGFTGCATTASNSSAPAASAETQRLAAYTLTKNATLLILQKEPGAEASLAAVSAGIDAVFAKGELTPEQLKAALDALKVSPKSQLLLASALTDAYNLYVAATGQKIVVTTDPTATAILKGVQQGIGDGIAFARAFQPPTTVPESPGNLGVFTTNSTVIKLL